MVARVSQPRRPSLVQNGTLKQGDMVLAGQEFGRVRAMFDESGELTDNTLQERLEKFIKDFRAYCEA